MTIQVTPLKQYLENIQVLAPDKTEKQVQELFKTIILENVDFNGNEEMLTYLSDKDPNFEKQHRSRNFIVEETETNNIIGFFSLSLKVVDISDLEKSLKKKLVLKGKSPKNIDYLPVLLIGQFGKNTNLNKLSGQELFEIVIQKIEEFRAIVGTQMVFLDSINHPKVIQFYEQFGFVAYSQLIKDDHQVTYQPMALNMSLYKK
ncbi:TPA: hypothetical protein ACOP8E_001542 [Streptococcus pneumoniae]